MKIVFMGTPQFAVPSLRKIVESKHDIIGVVTGSDCKRGRGQRVRKTAIKKVAENLNTKILQPECLSDDDFYQDLQDLNPDVFVVVAFRILPERLLSIPEFGAINLHASLLPKYRGPAPINWAIINGEKETGYTIFQIEKSVDTGDMLKQEKIPIKNTDTCQEVHDTLAKEGATGLLSVLQDLEEGKREAIPQKDEEATKAPKINSEMGRIDWSQKAEKIKNLINGLSPYPGAFSFFNGKRVKFIRANYKDKNYEKKPGEIAFVNNYSMGIQTGDGVLIPIELQKSGKRVLPVKDFINGFKGKAGDEFTSKRS
ncbi:MAG TPA: methionyl-tRNA formyltransferase [bacterium]|nr:methionyl-tRNA formyltransferase [bacterium]